MLLFPVVPLSGRVDVVPPCSFDMERFIEEVDEIVVQFGLVPY